MLTIKLDTSTKGIFDATYFDQRLEIDSKIQEHVSLIEAMNYVIVKSYDASLRDFVKGKRKLKESEDFFVRNYEDFQVKMEQLVNEHYDLGESNIERDFNLMLNLLYGVIIICVASSMIVILLERLFNAKEHTLLDLCKSFGRPETIN